MLVCGDGDQSLAPNEGSLSYLLLKYANYTGKNSHVVMSQNLSFSNKASAAAASSWTGAIRNQDSDLQRSFRVQGDPSPSNFKLNVPQGSIYFCQCNTKTLNIRRCRYVCINAKLVLKNKCIKIFS